jgi:uncharacterized membrane protein YkgB
MSPPEVPDPVDPRRSRIKTAILVLIGIVMLLPGLLAAFVSVVFGAAGAGLPFMTVSFLLAVGGIWLIVWAFGPRAPR